MATRGAEWSSFRTTRRPLPSSYSWRSSIRARVVSQGRFFARLPPSLPSQVAGQDLDRGAEMLVARVADHALHDGEGAQRLRGDVRLAFFHGEADAGNHHGHLVGEDAEGIVELQHRLRFLAIERA